MFIPSIHEPDGLSQLNLIPQTLPICLQARIPLGGLGASLQHELELLLQVLDSSFKTLNKMFIQQHHALGVFHIPQRLLYVTSELHLPDIAPTLLPILTDGIADSTVSNRKLLIPRVELLD